MASAAITAMMCLKCAHCVDYASIKPGNHNSEPECTTYPALLFVAHRKVALCQDSKLSKCLRAGFMRNKTLLRVMRVGGGQAESCYRATRGN